MHSFSSVNNFIKKFSYFHSLHLLAFLNTVIAVSTIYYHYVLLHTLCSKTFVSLIFPCSSFLAFFLSAFLPSIVFFFSFLLTLRNVTKSCMKICEHEILHCLPYIMFLQPINSTVHGRCLVCQYNGRTWTDSMSEQVQGRFGSKRQKERNTAEKQWIMRSFVMCIIYRIILWGDQIKGRGNG